MQKEKAKALMDAIMSINDSLNDATHLTLDMTDQDEAKRVRSVLGEIGSRLYVDLMRPIIRAFPDLDPDA